MTNTMTPILNEGQPAPALSTEEQNQLVLPGDPWSDTRALDTVRKDFQRAEQWRMQNYDKSLRRNDDVYYAVTKAKTWEGTRIPRASVPIWMAMRHIQAIHAHVMQSLFSDDYPFEALPEAGTKYEDAIKVRDTILSYMQDLNPEVIGMTAREIFSRSWYSALTYGCGPIEIGWAMKEMYRETFSRNAIPQMVPQVHPGTGEIVQVPSGNLRWEVVRGTKKYQLSRPKAQNILVYDFYWDPNCPSPNPQEAGYVCTRQLLPIWWIKENCLEELGFKLPTTDKEWRELVSKYKQTMAEVSAGWGEMNRGNYWNRSIEQTSDLAQQRVEVVRYWTGHRYVWLLGRDFLAYNHPNDLGIKPFVNNYYLPAPGRPYGISVCDVLEGEQKITQTLTEARLDELSLSIHPPIVRKLGVKIATSQRKFRPGVEWEVPDNAQTDIVKMDMGNITQSAYIETQAADMRAQQTTGANDISAMGSATSGGNSANRTATGVQTQNAAFSSRIQALVENCEDQAFEPFLKMLFLMAQKYGDPNQPIFAGSQTVDPLDVMNAQVRFKLKASDKLRIRRAAASGALASVLQIAPALQGQLAAFGQSLNYELLGSLIGDSLGVPSGNFVVAMTPEQQQFMAQQMQAQNQFKQNLQDTRLQQMGETKHASEEFKGLVELVKKLLTPEVVAQLAKEKGEPALMNLLEAKVQPKQLAAGK